MKKRKLRAKPSFVKSLVLQTLNDRTSSFRHFRPSKPLNSLKDKRGILRGETGLIKKSSNANARRFKPVTSLITTPLESKPICARRKERKEVLFARGKVGNGVKIHTSKTFTAESHIRCK